MKKTWKGELDYETQKIYLNSMSVSNYIIMFLLLCNKNKTEEPVNQEEYKYTLKKKYDIIGQVMILML